MPLLKLELTNKRICKFYHDNPSINFEGINLVFIDLFEKLNLDKENSSNYAQVMTAISENTNNINEIKHSVSALKETVSNTNSENYRNILNKLVEIKQEYIEDVKTIVQTNTYERIGPLIDKNNSMLIDKTSIVLNDIIPKNQTQFHSQISESMNSFYKSISEDSKTLSQSSNTQSMKEFIQNFEIKSSLMLQNIQQPIYSYISASEERINNSINKLKDGNGNQFNNQTIVSDLGEMLCEFRNSQVGKTSYNVQPLSAILTKLFNSAEISLQNTIGNPGIVLLKRIRKNNILVQNKDSEENISTDDINSFMHLIEENNCNGIFLSQRSGIATKKNFQIELHNNNVIIFVHNCEYSPSKIELAISVIDNLSSKLRQFRGKSEDDCNIPKDVLDTINNEYQLFISQKNAVIDVFKESQRKVLAQIDELRFPSLDKYLSTKYSAPIQKPGLKCDLCKSFSANNLKALAAHKRGCMRKLAVSPITASVTTISNSIVPISV